MKKIITVFVFCFLCGKCFPQAGEWVWIKGDSVPNQPGSYGVQGVSSPANNPPALYEPCEWTDLNGNFWMFESGGNVLWKYNPQTNEWVWVKGINTTNAGNYGIQGVPSPSNLPPPRVTCSASWTDLNNNLWLFGGQRPGVGGLCDLWKYDISTNEWTWMKGPNTGSQPGIYGSIGVPNPANNPGARWETSAAWTDTSNNLWLFGGYEINHGMFNDLWRFNIGTNMWTWMKGSQLNNQPGVYGTKGIESPSNTPGARQAYGRWRDNNDNLWLFGGYNGGAKNDLWRFNLLTNNWTWMAGDSLSTSSVFGIKCISSIINKPRGRFENRTAYKDLYGNLWIFGGTNSNAFSQVWNDLWAYNILSNEWTWESGDSISTSVGTWGAIGVSSPANKPNGRAGAVGWSDLSGHLYLFGGSTIGFNGYNDLWKYTIDTACVLTIIQENNFTNELLVFPNPTNSSFTISFTSSEKQNIELRIYNTLGKQIYVEKSAITKGKFEKEINVKKWSEGIYFLQVKMKEGVVSKKVVVQH